MTLRCRIACVLAVASLAGASGLAQSSGQSQTTPTWNPQGSSPSTPAVQQPGTPAPAPPQVVGVAETQGPKTPADVKLGSKPISSLTRLTLIRGLEAEFVFVRRTFPMGEKGLELKAGSTRITPEEGTLRQEIADHGAAARPGDRGQITSMEIRGNSIVFELNGGPKKKTKWYQRIQVGGSGGMVPVGGGVDNTMAHGSLLTLDFDKFVPEMTVADVKALLNPVFDFSSRSATQAYADIMPPKVKAALKDHRVLVGMNHEMVLSAKGRPEQKLREREDTTDYEEWIYGLPPQEVTFVRFVGDEVTRVEVMPVNGDKVVRTEREVDYPPGQVPGTASAVQAASAEGQPAAPGQPAGAQTGQPSDSQSAAKRPTLRRPGEAPAQTDDPNTVTVRKTIPGMGQPTQNPLPGPPLPPTSPGPGQTGTPGGPPE